MPPTEFSLCRCAGDRWSPLRWARCVPAMFAQIKGSLREGAGATAPEGERETVEILQSGGSYTVVAPKIWRLVSKTKSNF